jgi:chromosome segregation ATPase
VTLALANLAAWRPVESAVAEIRRECSAAQQFMEEQLAEIDRLRDQLAFKADELTAAEERLAEQRESTGRLSEQLQQQDGVLGETLAELRGLRDQFARECEEARKREGEAATVMQQRLAQIEAERDTLRRQVELLESASSGGQGQAETLSPLLSVLDELRHEVHDTRSELAGAIQQAAGSHGEHPPGEALSAESTEHIVALERQRAELESELELVRTRSAELQETVNQQRRALADQRDELTAELRLLRELVEQRAELHAAQPANEPVVPTIAIRPPTPAAAAAESQAPADPVVNSVMAQFARLQKDVAQRRQKKQ